MNPKMYKLYFVKKDETFNFFHYLTLPDFAISY